MRLALTLTMLAGPVLAEGTIVVSPIYSQLVAFATPPGFVAGFENESKGFYILELVPKGESVEAWTQMITITGGKGQAAGLSVTDAAGVLAEGYQGACPRSFTALKLPSPGIKGALATFAGYMGCGNAGGQSEAMVFVVVQGTSEVYTLQWAEHGPAKDAAPDPDPSVWQPRADMLGLTRICDKVEGEGTPYPSCTE